MGLPSMGKWRRRLKQAYASRKHSGATPEDNLSPSSKAKAESIAANLPDSRLSKGIKRRTQRNTPTRLTFCRG